jgi:hypothetical protein
MPNNNDWQHGHIPPTSMPMRFNEFRDTKTAPSFLPSNCNEMESRIEAEHEIMEDVSKTVVRDAALACAAKTERISGYGYAERLGNSRAACSRSDEMEKTPMAYPMRTGS